MTRDQLQALEDRQRRIAEEMAALRKEAEELAIAKRVLERFGLTTAGQNGQKSEEDSGGRPRPNGTPTNFEMAEFVLSTAEKDGKDGLTANELVDAIAARYWPGLVGEQILPSLYQFAKKGRLRKTASGKFKRIRKNEGSADHSAEPS